MTELEHKHEVKIHIDQQPHHSGTRRRARRCMRWPRSSRAWSCFAK